MLAVLFTQVNVFLLLVYQGGVAKHRENSVNRLRI